MMRKAYPYVAIALVLMTFPVSLLSQESPRVAILISGEDAKNYFERHYPGCLTPFPAEVCGNKATFVSGYLGENEYQRYYKGWIYALEHAPARENAPSVDALKQEKIPYDPIFDADLTDAVLNKYDVLILSNTPSISDDHAKTIRQWVIRGGRLIATFGAGYKQILGTDASVYDTMKLQEGGTNGLHQLWKDPLNKMVSSGDLACTTESLAAGDKTCCDDWLHTDGSCDTCVGVDVRISRYEGPTLGLKDKLDNNILGYRGMGNLLVQRPENSDRVLAFLKFQFTPYDRPSPAIIVSDQAKGRVVYFAFAPEFDVSLHFGLPEFGEVMIADESQIWKSDYEQCIEPLTKFPPGTWGNVEAMMLLMRDTVRWMLESK
jgi:hypothetical protein